MSPTPYTDSLGRPGSVKRIQREAPRSGTYRRIARETRPFWPHLVALVALSVVGSVLALLLPVPLKIAIDSVIGSHPVPGFLDPLLPSATTGSDSGLLLATVGLFLLIAFLMQAQEGVGLMLSTYTGERLQLNFRSKIFAHVQRLSFTYHDTRGTLDSSYRIQWDAPAVRHIAPDASIPLLTAGLTVLGMIVVTAVIDWQLAAVALGVAPVLFLTLWVYGSRLRRQWLEAKALESDAFSVVHEALGALRVVTAFGREQHERDRFEVRSGESVNARIKVSVTESLLRLMVGMTLGLGTALVLFIGVRRVQDGALTLGELLLVMTYLTQLYEPIRTVTTKVGDLQSAVASAERAFAVLDEAPDLVERPNARPLSRATGTVAFRGVSFAYAEGRPVLSDVSFEVEAGTSLGIAGGTGAGKTTLISLLTRFYDPTSGQVLLDGVDLRDYRLGDLRDQFAIVLQDPVLFSTSVGENISYARPGASEADVIAAAHAANAHDFIMRLPRRYATTVGERGMRLSGGERQRIALARAFLKDAPVLVLDEPTSSVDVDTEAVIIEAMERLMSGRTTFMIAHRLSTLEHCDTGIRIERGGIVRTRSPLGFTSAGSSALRRPRAASGGRPSR